MAEVGGGLSDIDPQTGWEIWQYRVPGAQVVTPQGYIVSDRYSFDLPDGTSNGLPHIQDESAIFFPGDVIHYHIEVQDDRGNLTTLPQDLTGFEDFTEGTVWSREMTARGLPSLYQGTQPEILFWNDFGHRGGENEYLQAFRQNGLVEGADYDTYTTKGPSSGVGNGLGSSGYHGANAEQIADYDVLIYVLGNLSSISISDGTGDGDNDLSADLATVEAWANADADRYHAYFGDDFVSSMIDQGALCQDYLNHVLGVDLLSGDVSSVIDGQLTPSVVPTGQGSGPLASSFIANGGCLNINDFDDIGVFGVGPVIAHEFTDRLGTPYSQSVAGSIEWRRTDASGNTKHTIVFPYDLSNVDSSVEAGVAGISGRALLLRDILTSWGMTPGGPAIGAPDHPSAVPRFEVDQNHPNPFNPRTRIEFSLPQRGTVRVTLYNVRGEKVATLLDEVRGPGPGFVDWDGRDARGTEVSSGVYLYKVEAGDEVAVKKMALIR